MKRILVLTVLSCLLSVANADGDAEAGKALTGMCLACHGQDGNSLVGAFPNIAGQSSQYLIQEMLEMKSGVRAVPVMAGMLDAMSETDLADLAAFYESQPRAAGVADPELVEFGETIYRAGIARKGIAACSVCHSPTGGGNGPAGFPALAGQWPEYTAQQLKAFRSGERHDDGEAEMMRTTAEDLSDKEIAAVSSYIHGLR